LDAFDVLVALALAPAGTEVLGTGLVLVIGGSPVRSSDNRRSHQEKPRCIVGIGDAAAIAPRFSGSTNACGTREVEENIDLGDDSFAP
jgi:hypothetical protein